MSDKSGIEWTDATWNPIRGTKGKWHCVKVSEGCRNCYAERMNIRFGGPAYVKGADTLRLDKHVLEQPLHWKRPRMVFVCSMTDLFHTDVKDGWIQRILRVMMDAPQHTYQILTKRPHRLQDRWRNVLGVLPHVWLGVSVEDQATFDQRAPVLMDVSLAGLRFISYEPALGPLDLGCDCWLSDNTLPGNRCRKCGKVRWLTYAFRWVIAGGESGPGARAAHPDWFRRVRDQCQATNVPFFFKQWGAWGPAHPEVIPTGPLFKKVGKKKAGRELDGRTWDEMPGRIQLAENRKRTEQRRAL